MILNTPSFLNRSGTEEEVDEKLVLLQDVTDMYEDSRQEEEARNETQKKKDESKKRQGESIREQAMARQPRNKLNDSDDCN